MYSSSDKTFIPNSVALFNFDPALSPAITRDVFFETLDETFAPFRRRFSLISSLEYFCNLPVRTILRFKSGISSNVGDLILLIFTLPNKSSINRHTKSFLKKLIIFDATLGPISSIDIKSAKDASCIFLNSLKLLANDLEVDSPTSGMPSEYINLCKSIFLEISIDLIRLLIDFHQILQVHTILFYIYII